MTDPRSREEAEVDEAVIALGRASADLVDLAAKHPGRLGIWQRELELRRDDLSRLLDRMKLPISRVA